MQPLGKSLDRELLLSEANQEEGLGSGRHWSQSSDETGLYGGLLPIDTDSQVPTLIS